MADLISSNDGQQEMAKQVEAIAEAAAQRDSQIAQMLNLVPKAAALSTAASRAINFTKKTWVDDPTSGTPITAADMNRLEQAIVDLNTTLASLQDSLSHWNTATLNTDILSDGAVTWLRLGDALLVNFCDVILSKTLNGELLNGTTLASGLPSVTTNSGMVSRISGSKEQMRVRVLNGSLITHYTTSVEAANNQFYGLMALKIT